MLNVKASTGMLHVVLSLACAPVLAAILYRLSRRRMSMTFLGTVLLVDLCFAGTVISTSEDLNLRAWWPVIAMLWVSPCAAVITLGTLLLMRKFQSRAGSKTDEDLTQCHRCGYPKKGLLGARCPECGILTRDAALHLHCSKRNST